MFCTKKTGIKRRNENCKKNLDQKNSKKFKFFCNNQPLKFSFMVKSRKIDKFDFRQFL